MATVDASPEEGKRTNAQWKFLFYFAAKKHLVPLILSCACSLICGIMVPVLAVLLGSVFNELASFGSQSISNTELLHRVSVYCLYLVALGAATWVGHTAHFGLWVVCGQLQAKMARETLFDAMLRADIEWFEMTEDGVAALLPRIQTYIHDLQQATSQPLGFTAQNLVAAVASLVLALYMSWKLALVSLATVPLSAAVMAIASKKIQRNMEAQQAELTTASKLANGAIASIDSVKYFTAETSELRQYVSAVHGAARWYLKEALACASEIGCIHLLTFGMFVQGFWYGEHLVASGELNAGQVLTTFWACLQATQSIEELIPQLMVLEKGRAAAAFLKDLLEQIRKHRIVRRKHGRKSPRYCEGDIRFKNVVFAYPSQPSRHVLCDCSLFFPAGDMTFIVGKSGSGKSTIGNLLTKFYEPLSGEILVDGNSIETLDINWIRNNITLVQQQSSLFNETVFKNIAFGSRDSEKVSEDHILTSIRFAGLSDTLHKLSNGLDTVVGVHGNLLSGGQRQRVALARSRLRDTPILILDESTSALDPPRRREVMDALRSWRKGKTTIIITHDSSQILEDDFAYVVEEGQVTHRGYKRILKHEPGGPFHGPDTIYPPTQLARVSKLEDLRDSLSPSDPHTAPISSPLFRRLTRFSPLESPSRRSWLHSPPGSRASVVSSGLMPRLPETDKHEDNTIRDSAWHIDEKEEYQGSDLHDKTTPLQTSETDGFSTFSNVGRTVVSSLGLRDRLFLFIGFLCAVCHAAATPVFSYMFSHLLGTFFVSEGGSQQALKWALAVLAVSVANGGASFGMHYLLERCSQSWVDHLRYESMRRILSQPRHWFEKDGNDPSRLVNCLDRNAEEMKNLIGKFAGFILVAAVMIVMGVIWGAAVCWKLALVGAGCAPLLYGLTRIFDAVTQKWEGRCGHAKEVIADIFAETFLDIRTVRALTLESYLHRKHYKASWQALTIGLKRACYTASLFGTSESSIIFVYAAVFYYGAVLVSSLEYSTSEVLIVFSMLLFSMVNVKAVLSLVPQISASRDNAARVLELVALPDNKAHEHQGTHRIISPLPIKFTNVNFSYPSRPDNLVLRKLNLCIRENMCTAIVGASGSGKSTITSLLLSLYHLDSRIATTNGLSGLITLGGLDIRKAHVPTLRSLVAVVPQHPSLFPSSIRANITYGLDESSSFCAMENVRDAARAAGIHDFISSLPYGYDTVVGDGGLGLSGGQTQRLVIARALVRHPRVLILDEATSSLDLASAEVVRRSLRSLMTSRTKLTVVIITHAKEMVEVADHVVVLERGRVAEEGSWHELQQRKRDGPLWRLGLGLSSGEPVVESPSRS